MFDYSKQFARAQTVTTIETEFADVTETVQADVSAVRAAARATVHGCGQ